MYPKNIAPDRCDRPGASRVNHSLGKIPMVPASWLVGLAFARRGAVWLRGRGLSLPLTLPLPLPLTLPVAVALTEPGRRRRGRSPLRHPYFHFPWQIEEIIRGSPCVDRLLQHLYRFGRRDAQSREGARNAQRGRRLV